MKPLREWRAEKLLSVRDLARIAGVSNKTINQIEGGHGVPTFRTIRRITTALDVEASHVEEFARAIEHRGKDRALNSPGRGVLGSVAAATAAGPFAV